MSESESVKKGLPKEVSEYLETMKTQKGKNNIVKELETQELTLDFLSDALIEGLNPKELTRKYKPLKYYPIYRFLKVLEPYKEELIAYLKTVADEPKEFRACKSIKQWENQIRLSGHLSMLRYIRELERICKGEIVKGFKCSPEKFDLERAQDFVSKYLKETKRQKVTSSYRLAIRHFLASKGQAIPRGFGAQYGLSGEKDSYGKYAHIKFSEDQLRQIREINAKSKEAQQKGFDIAFEIGVQTCSRAFAIGSLETAQVKKFGDLNVLRVFEPKIKEGAEHLGFTGKYWTKYVSHSLYARIQRFIHKNLDRTLLFCDANNITAVRTFLNEFRKYMKRVYKQIGIVEPYFYGHCLHALRHAGAHRLLKLTNYNYDMVARLGGWTDTKTLKDCYGEMPEDILIAVVSKLEQDLNGIGA